MADIFTKEKRSEIMSKIRSVSMLEKQFVKLLAKEIYPKGYRYRLNYKPVPGRPDVAFVSHKLAIFIDGDFWHGYKFEERRVKLPSAFWVTKIETNMRRDRRNRRKLTQMGWRMVRLWEHDIRKRPDECVGRVVDALRGSQPDLADKKCYTYGMKPAAQKFSPSSHSTTIANFKKANGRPFKPNGKKPINRPK